MVIIDFKHAAIEAWRTCLKVDIFYMISFLFKKSFFPSHLISTFYPIIYSYIQFCKLELKQNLKYTTNLRCCWTYLFL